MTVVNGAALLAAQPIAGMLPHKVQLHGVSHGLAEVGYDIRLKQDIRFNAEGAGGPVVSVLQPGASVPGWQAGRFTLASAQELFQMPPDLVGIVHDKSTWARHGLSVFNTVIEPGWRGYLTLELVYHGQGDLHLPMGAGIAQVVFHRLAQPAAYAGKYQDQEDRPVEPRHPAS